MKERSLLLIILLCAIFSICIPGVMAQNISFSTLEQLGPQDILIYTWNGTQQSLYGQWNTTSLDVPVPTTDFNIIIRPSAVARFSNPTTLLTDAMSFTETNLFALIAIVMIIGVLWRKR